MNLVLHPTSSDRSVPFQSKARKRLNSGKTRPSANGTPVPGPSVHPTSQADASVSRSSTLIVPSPDPHNHRRARRALITPALQMNITPLIPSNHRIRRRWNRITLVLSSPMLSGTTAHIRPEMRVGIPNPLSHPYSHSTALMNPGMRITLLGISPRRPPFGPGPRTPRTITSNRKTGLQKLSTNPSNSNNLSLTTGMAQASGRRSPSYQILKPSPVRVNIRLPRPSNHENSRHPR